MVQPNCVGGAWRPHGLYTATTPFNYSEIAFGCLMDSSLNGQYMRIVYDSVADGMDFTLVNWLWRVGERFPAGILQMLGGIFVCQFQ